MLLETKSIIQFALLWGSTWVVASLAIASVLTMALVGELRRLARSRSAGRGSSARALSRCSRSTTRSRSAASAFESRAVESLFYAVLMFSPILCAGSAVRLGHQALASLARDYGTNLLGAMAGGVGEYLSLVTGFRWLLLVIASCYVGALVARGAERGTEVTEGTERASTQRHGTQRLFGQSEIDHSQPHSGRAAVVVGFAIVRRMRSNNRRRKLRPRRRPRPPREGDARAAEGQENYQKNCQACHGPRAVGAAGMSSSDGAGSTERPSRTSPR